MEMSSSLCFVHTSLKLDFILASAFLHHCTLLLSQQTWPTCGHRACWTPGASLPATGSELISFRPPFGQEGLSIEASSPLGLLNPRLSCYIQGDCSTVNVVIVFIVGLNFNDFGLILVIRRQANEWVY